MNISIYPVPFQSSPTVDTTFVDANAGSGFSYYGVTSVYSEDSESSSAVKFNLLKNDKVLGAVFLPPEQAESFKSELISRLVFKGQHPLELREAC
jgi:hypothetical protein